MLYGSSIGALAGQNVYTRASDGAVIGDNLVPSSSDVQRLLAIYPEVAPRPAPCLLNQVCNSARTAWSNTIGACTGD